MRWTAVLGLVLLTSACGGSDRPPEVDWSQIPQAQRNVIDREVDEEDCVGMQAVLDGSEVADVLSYLDWHMQDAGCYE